MTELVRPSGGPWTLPDLQRLPDVGDLYEITDGSLVVSPPPALPHVRVTTLLRRLLEAQAPPSLMVGETVGVGIDYDARRTTVRVPDLTILHATAIERDDLALDPGDVVAVVEVLSPGSTGVDVVTKRHQYGKAQIPQYWIVDPRQRTLTVLRHDGHKGYDESAVVSPGETYRAREPFPLSLDPGDFL
jgi:Uma2 family endonuclease